MVQAVEVELQDSENGDSSDLVLFFGRFHPFLVHLPIGFLLFAILLEFISIFPRFEYLKSTVSFALAVGGLSALAAGITGYLLSFGGGYDEELLSYHKWLGTSVIILSLVAFILRTYYYDHPVFRKVFRVILIFLAVIVMSAGHFGGSLTHGSDYLFRYMPQTLKTWMNVEVEEEEQIALIEDLDTARVYDHIIYPIIRTRCESCHNNDRREADLMMTSFDQMMKGSENGPVIQEHQAEESELFKRLVLPERDEDRMPPRGRRQLTHDQIKLVAWWIEEGVPSTQTVSELELSDEISDILHKLTVDGQSFYEKTVVPKAEESLLDTLRTHGFRISPVAEDLNFLQVGMSKSVTAVSAEAMELLRSASEQITWIDFSGLSVTDQDLSPLSDFKHLTRLNLSNTSIGDSTLLMAGTMENLDYLNVYDTQITDGGLQHLEELESLSSLFLWKTKVSHEAIESLQEKLPNLYINYGYEL
ncbi:MAG: c-type cytochrome domain-containing protein [Balneolaceae bacterium]